MIIKGTLTRRQVNTLAAQLYDDIRKVSDVKQGILTILEKHLVIVEDEQVGLRPTRHEVLMDCAMVWATRGTCCRLKVGAVLAKDGRIISHGYNGALPGHRHCTPDTCNDSGPCLHTVHAERNAINWARVSGIVDFSKMVLYLTDSPCIDCAKFIVEVGVGEVVYNRKYRIEDGINWLRQNNVKVSQLPR